MWQGPTDPLTIMPVVFEGNDDSHPIVFLLLLLLLLLSSLKINKFGTVRCSSTTKAFGSRDFRFRKIHI